MAAELPVVQVTTVVPFKQSEVPELAARPLKVTVLEALKVVNAPVEGVLAPMAVELMPVAVVLKLPAVTVRLLAPALMEEADRPETVRAPLVAVKFKAPVARVRPLLAVSNPALVIVPVPEVERLPEVVTLSPAVAGCRVVPTLVQ